MWGFHFSFSRFSKILHRIRLVLAGSWVQRVWPWTRMDTSSPWTTKPAASSSFSPMGNWWLSLEAEGRLTGSLQVRKWLYYVGVNLWCWQGALKCLSSITGRLSEVQQQLTAFKVNLSWHFPKFCIRKMSDSLFCIGSDLWFLVAFLAPLNRWISFNSILKMKDHLCLCFQSFSKLQSHNK